MERTTSSRSTRQQCLNLKDIRGFHGISQIVEVSITPKKFISVFFFMTKRYMVANFVVLDCMNTDDPRNWDKIKPSDHLQQLHYSLRTLKSLA